MKIIVVLIYINLYLYYNLVMKFNENLLKLDNEDCFYICTKKIKEYKTSHPGSKVVSLGIGDVSFPVAPFVVEKMEEAARRQGKDGFIGYGYSNGIPELIDAIRQNEYPQFSNDEIYVSDGTKSDAGNLLEMFDKDAIVGIYNPTYPIYANSVYCLNRKVDFIDLDDQFLPVVPNKHFDVLYLCSPSNPTGINFSKEQLKPIIDYAIKEGCVILYDNVYFSFIEGGVKSIYEVDGARKCAIEMRSFSKHASFTGVRCSYYVVPNEIHPDINKYWKCRNINRFNGASYIAQAGALASFDAKVKKDITNNIGYYKNNLRYLVNSFTKLGYEICGGRDAPYIWVKNKNNLSSWEVFDLFLNSYEVIVVPGCIFGSRGEGYFRVSALGKYEDIVEAINRIEKYEKK